MKKIIILIVLLYSGISSNGQITLAHSYGPIYAQAQVVNLSLSGKKYMVTTHFHNDSTIHAPDTISFYNLDYSFWKRIVCPYIPGYGIASVVSGPYNSPAVYYPSETLFNTDALLEVAVPYLGVPASTGKILIINELGSFIDSITNVISSNNGYFKVYSVDTLSIGFQAIVQTPTGVAIYNLPGTLPCNLCSGNGLGLAKLNNRENNIPTEPLPNPSVNEVKITFTLPEGVSQGNLVLYNTNGQKIKTLVVDNRFGFVLLDNSQLAAGVYYYNIEANGTISSTQKMVVIK